MKISDGVLMDVSNSEIVNGEFEIPDSVTCIGDWAFHNCNLLKEVKIPDGVTCIGDCAFDFCTSLTEVKIPDDVTKIEKYPFYNCTSLTEITYKGTKRQVKCVDGYVMEIRNTKKIRDYTIYQTFYFGTECKSVVTEKDGKFAHGESTKEAIHDLEYKLCRNRGIGQYSAYTLDSRVDYTFYRVMTGACQQGTDEFMKRVGMKQEDTRTIKEVIEMTEGEYGHDQLLHNLRELGILD